MKERPIMFKPEMVRAILSGVKTQTRRPIKRGQVFRFCREGEGPCDLSAAERREINAEPFRWELENPAHPAPSELLTLCPYGVAGDRLWVKETWASGVGLAVVGSSEELIAPPNAQPAPPVIYRADGASLPPGVKWRSSLHMPRRASRLTVEVVDVRVERVQSITEEDAIAEGVDSVSLADVPRQATTSRRADFAQLWDRLYAKTWHAWANNPWVWVVEFRRVNEAREEPTQ